MSLTTLAGLVDAIVIGASAGGVEALGQLLPALPRSLSVPIAVVLHLPPRRESLLVEVFAPKCACPVHEAVDKEPLIAGHIYFAPPDYHLLIDQGPQFALSLDPEVLFSRPSIDVLFESAADLYGSRVAAVILSGANEDGAEGVRAIRKAGGIIMVQEPSEATVTTMVDAAINAVDVDGVLTLSEMTKILQTLAAGARS